MGLIDSKSALVQVMVWRRIGAKSSPEQMMTQSSALNELIFDVAVTPIW